MNDLSFDRITRTIYEAPVGHYLGRDGAEVLARYATEEIHLKDRQALYRKGEDATAFYIITKGRFAMVREKTDSRPEVILHVLDEGDLTGELSFIDRSAHTITCCALGDAAALVFQMDSVDPLIDQHPRVLFNFMRAVIVRSHQTTAAIRTQQQELADYIATGGRRR